MKKVLISSYLWPPSITDSSVLVPTLEALFLQVAFISHWYYSNNYASVGDKLKIHGR